MQGTVVVHLCKELNAPATNEDKSDDSLGNFMQNGASVQNTLYVPHENSVTRFSCKTGETVHFETNKWE
jgi:hypothetical protein